MSSLTVRYPHRINVCDLPSKYANLQREFESSPNITPLIDGHAVSRSSDFILYSVEAEFIDRVVKEYGPCTFNLTVRVRPATSPLKQQQN